MTLKFKLLILFLLISINTFSQERKIIGRILDSGTQMPIKDANVVILGATSGTFTNQIGFFELTIDASIHKALIVSHRGFKTYEIQIPAEDHFKLFLEKEYTLLNKLNLNAYPKRVANELTSEVSKTKNDSDIIIVESDASFPGGLNNFYDFIGNALASELPQVDEQGFNIVFEINESGEAVEISISDSTELVKTAVRQTFQKMPNWTPATQRQNRVSQYFLLPIISADIPDIEALDLKDFYNFFSENIKYPVQARRMGIEGAVFAEFQVDNLGNVISVKLLKDIGADCGDEVRRIIIATPIELTKSLYDKSHFNKFILPVSFGLDRPLKIQQFTASSDALLLNEVVVLAIGVVRETRRLGNPTGVSRSAPISIVSSANFTFTSLSKALEDPKSVKRLSLINNSINSFPSEILKLNNLEFLDLERNDLQKLPNEIGLLTNLQELYLFENKVESLPLNFRNLKRLKILGLASNQLKSFPMELISLQKLEALDLSNNQISFLPPEIGSMKNLKFLILDNNGISRIPQEFYKLKKLEKIYIQGNPIDPKDFELLKAKFKKAEIVF